MNPFDDEPDDNQTEYDKIGETEQHISETTAILKQNVAKVIDRGERLENISERSERLNQNSVSFRLHSTRLRRAMWLKNRWLVISIVIVVLLIIILIIVLTVQPWKKKSD